MSLEQLNLLEIMSSDSALNCQSESEELKTFHDVESQSCSRLSENETKTQSGNSSDWAAFLQVAVANRKLEGLGVTASKIAKFSPEILLKQIREQQRRETQPL